MTTDNRTNEPTEAQVEAAAKAIADNLFSRWTLDSRVRASKDRGSLIHVAARAALEAAARAAQGAAPQGESKCQTCSREASFCAHCVAEMELAPVLPSSGVDETREGK